MISKNKYCDHQNCENESKHYHGPNGIVPLEKDQSYCGKCGKSYVTKVTTDCLNQHLPYVQKIKENEKGQTSKYKIYYEHCKDCCDNYPYKIEEERFEEIEYDCCFYPGNKKLSVVHLKHKCGNKDAILYDEETYGINKVCSTKTWQMICDPCSMCRSERDYSCFYNDNEANQDAICCYFCCELLLCFPNPLYWYKMCTLKGKYPNGSSSYKWGEDSQKIARYTCHYQRCFINNNPCFLVDYCCNQNDCCFDFFSYNSNCCSQIVEKRYNLISKCSMENCNQNIHTDEIHCKGCNSHVKKNSLSHCQECCEGDLPYNTDSHCKICHGDYSNSPNLTHCCTCKKTYRKYQKHCCGCNKIFEYNEKHCCRCSNAVYKFRTCICEGKNVCGKCKTIYEIDEIHCHSCGITYKEDKKHCHGCKAIYAENHCDKCHMSFTNCESHCHECKIVYNKDQGHCHKCKAVYDESNGIKHSDCCKIYDSKKFFHCKTCHACYSNSKNCPSCEGSFGDSCHLCCKELGKDFCRIEKCKHSFHKECITDWIRKGNLKCPTCNENHNFSTAKYYDESETKPDIADFLPMIHRK
jgi:hypothetical protein